MSFRNTPATAPAGTATVPTRRERTLGEVVGKGLHTSNVEAAREALNAIPVTAISGKATQETWKALSNHAILYKVGISLNDEQKNPETVVTDDGSVYRIKLADGSYGRVYPDIPSDAAVEADNQARVKKWAQSSSAIVDAANTEVTHTVDLDSEPDYVITKKTGKVYANSRPHNVTHPVTNGEPKKTTYACALTLLPNEFGSGSVVTAVRS